MKGRKILNIILKPGIGIFPEKTTAIGEPSGLDKCYLIEIQLGYIQSFKFSNHIKNKKNPSEII